MQLEPGGIRTPYASILDVGGEFHNVAGNVTKLSPESFEVQAASILPLLCGGKAGGPGVGKSWECQATWMRDV